MVKLSPIEARIIGVLMEKEKTTPDYYPMSPNALTNACNQKNCRIPVTSFIQDEVQATLDAMEKQGLVQKWASHGRTAKYRHRFCNTEFSELQFNDSEFAIVCELLLRGAQTAGELKSRASRISSFESPAAVQTSLNSLIEKKLAVCVGKLDGKRDDHFIHQFTDGAEASSQGFDHEDVRVQTSAAQADEPSTLSKASDTSERDPAKTLAERVEALEQEVTELKALLNSLL